MTKNIIVTAVVALVVSSLSGFFFIGKSSQSNTNVDSEGVFAGLSERDIRATSLKVGSPTTRFNVSSSGANVSIGTTSTPTAQAIDVDGTGTTTLRLQSSTASRGTCIQMETVTGGTVAITVSGTTISAAATTCR